ncbi:MAG: glycosyltransferase family 2 protein [Chloroflexi bacterium]|nr:glycosyltransferase family 2 protein [Chloroflexota bacterium]
MHISTIVCTRNRPDLIGTALESILANDYASYDVLVVDQSTDDRTGAVVRGLMDTHSNLRYVHTPIAGLSRAYNIGIRESRGELIAFTDDDCVAPRDWLQSIADEFSGNPDADMLYGQVLRPTALADCTDIIPTLEFSTPRRFSRKDGFKVYGMGANFACRRRLFERIGYFDEILGGGGPLRSSQDFDLQYRAFLGGTVVLLSPTVKIDHYGVRTRQEWPATERAYGIGDGAFYFKHVRCGDVFALWLFARKMVITSLKDVVRLVRRRPTHTQYVRSCFTGIRMSLRFGVDRGRRIYQAAA